MSEVALKTVDEEIIIPKIKPQNVEINAEHFCWREFFIRLPQEITWVHIHEHADEVWKLVQSNPHVSLRALDRLVMLTWDQSEMAQAVVVVATGTKVVLGGFKKFPFSGRDSTAEFSDGTFAVRWDGQGYGIHRIKDNVRMRPSSYSTIELAKAEVRKMIPVKRSSNQ